jgi:hypothetical protein
MRIPRTKLTAALCALAVMTTAGLASASIPVAVFPFTNQSDLSSIIKIIGGKCVPNVTGGYMVAKVPDASPECAFRTSVISDSSDTAPTQDIQAAAGYTPKTPTTARAKLYVSVLARLSATGRYELRIVPTKQRWSLIRDPDGPDPPVVLKSGTGKFIKPGAGGAAKPTEPAKPTKPSTPSKSAAAAATPKATKSPAANILHLQVSGTPDSATIVATINGTSVFSGPDPNAGAPVGRFNGIAVGNKTGKAGTGMIGAFDNVTIRVPTPA